MKRIKLVVVPGARGEDSSISYAAALNNKSERKYNIIAYGFEECPNGTRKDERTTKDYENTSFRQLLKQTLNKRLL